MPPPLTQPASQPLPRSPSRDIKLLGGARDRTPRGLRSRDRRLRRGVPRRPHDAHSPAVAKFTTFVSNVLTRPEVGVPVLAALIYIRCAQPLECVFLGAVIAVSALSTGLLDVPDFELGLMGGDLLAHHEGLAAAAFPAHPETHPRTPARPIRGARAIPTRLGAAVFRARGPARNCIRAREFAASPLLGTRQVGWLAQRQPSGRADGGGGLQIGPAIGWGGSGRAKSRASTNTRRRERDTTHLPRLRSQHRAKPISTSHQPRKSALDLLSTTRRSALNAGSSMPHCCIRGAPCRWSWCCDIARHNTPPRPRHLWPHLHPRCADPLRHPFAHIDISRQLRRSPLR
ncbi:hypothetical protein B0H10DRAFT_2211454 [Mycena sp. CBHHK59/15]|nr:hypothetical protein B0H10DRAFT_2211454 [Mycena sp. CBHHK59/15]